MAEPDLPGAFLAAPLAHRALHNRADGRIENAPRSINAAIKAGYGIEIDIQQSRDGEAMVFHDDLLDRLTSQKGRVRDRDAADLTAIHLTDSKDCIPTLSEVLAQVAGRVPLLIEIKDQHGAMGQTDGVLEARVCACLTAYQGPVAVMSFNPHSVAHCQRYAPDISRGLTTSDFAGPGWRYLPAETRRHLATIPDLARVGARFVSHDRAALRMPRVTEIREAGLPVLCWTVRSLTEEQDARHIADNITFENYLATLPVG